MGAASARRTSLGKEPLGWGDRGDLRVRLARRYALRATTPVGDRYLFAWSCWPAGAAADGAAHLPRTGPDLAR